MGLIDELNAKIKAKEEEERKAKEEADRKAREEEKLRELILKAGTEIHKSLAN